MASFYGTTRQRMEKMIEKKIHVIWIGDQKKRPDRFIETWKEKNKHFSIRVWTDEDLENEKWETRDIIDKWYKKEINGAADVMRWEILYKYGGIAIDADSICVKPIEDWILEAQAFSCWENEIERPGLIACGFMGFEKKDPLLEEIMRRMKNDKNIDNDRAWKKVGPLLLTECYKANRYINLTIYPSHFFLPRHHTGLEYSGNGHVFAKQAWGSTNNNQYRKLEF